MDVHCLRAVLQARIGKRLADLFTGRKEAQQKQKSDKQDAKSDKSEKREKESEHSGTDETEDKEDGDTKSGKDEKSEKEEKKDKPGYVLSNAQQQLVEKRNRALMVPKGFGRKCAKLFSQSGVFDFNSCGS